MKTSAFQQAIESVESLPLGDQEILLNILQKRLQERRQTNLYIARAKRGQKTTP